MRLLLTTVARSHVHTLRELFPDLAPYTLQVLSAAVRPRHYAVQIDLQDERRPLTRLLRALDDHTPDVVGFSVNNMIDAEAVVALASSLRAQSPRSVRLLAGGQVPSFRPELFLAGGFDAVVVGEGERTLPELLDTLESGGPLDQVEGLALPGDGGGARFTPPRAPLASLDESPIPDWEGHLRPAVLTGGLAASMELCRGCPFGCSFCSVAGFHERRVVRKSLPRICEELDRLQSLGVTELYVLDDCFGLDDEQLIGFAEALEGRGMGWAVQVRADTVARHPDVFARAGRNGLFLAVVGFEGYRSGVFGDVGKGDAAGELTNAEAARVLREGDVAIFGTHLFGTPSDDWGGRLRTFRQGRRHSDVFRMTIYTPLLGSQLYRDLEAEGRIRDLSLSDFNCGHYVVEDDENAAALQIGYFGLILAHYLLPGTVGKALLHPNPTVRLFNRRAYRGAARFVAGELRRIVGR